MPVLRDKNYGNKEKTYLTQLLEVNTNHQDMADG